MHAPVLFFFFCHACSCHVALIGDSRVREKTIPGVCTPPCWGNGRGKLIKYRRSLRPTSLIWTIQHVGENRSIEITPAYTKGLKLATHPTHLSHPPSPRHAHNSLHLFSAAVASVAPKARRSSGQKHLEPREESSRRVTRRSISGGNRVPRWNCDRAGGGVRI